VKIPESALVAGCGYVGRRVARVWKERGLLVHAVTRSAEKAHELTSEGIETLVFDLAAETIPTLPDVDVVLWSVGFERSSGASRQAIWIDGLQRLLNALPVRSDDNPRKILYTSSTSVYGNGHGQDVDESSVPNPTAEGGQACVAAEGRLQEYSLQNSASVSILRLAGIYGPHRLLRRIEDLRSNTPITSAPDEWLNLIHVDDAVGAIDAVSRMECPPSLMNVVGSKSSTRGDYYRTLAKLANAPAPTFVEPSESTAEISSGSQACTADASRRKSTCRQHRARRPGNCLSIRFD
jgi:nucleoside-diphosphate-sugar epimerase